MIYYYFNLRKQNLISFDGESKEITVMERLQNVSVFTSSGDVQMGDFDSEEMPEKKRKILVLKKAHEKFKKNKKQSTGSRSEKVEKIEQMIIDGRPNSEIVDECDTTIGVVYQVKFRLKKEGRLGQPVKKLNAISVEEEKDEEDDIDSSIIADVIEMAQDHKDSFEISTELNIDIEIVKKIIKKNL